jgi:hypothetical protein
MVTNQLAIPNLREEPELYLKTGAIEIHDGDERSKYHPNWHNEIFSWAPQRIGVND